MFWLNFQFQQFHVLTNENQIETQFTFNVTVPILKSFHTNKSNHVWHAWEVAVCLCLFFYVCRIHGVVTKDNMTIDCSRSFDVCIGYLQVSKETFLYCQCRQQSMLYFRKGWQSKYCDIDSYAYFSLAS